MGEIIMKNWDLRKFRVRVNWPSLIRQVQVPICRVISLIRGLPNPIRQVVPLISHILIFIPYLSLSRPQLNHHRRTQSYVIPLTLPMPGTWVDTEYSTHWVQHTPSTAYTEHSLHRVQHSPMIVQLPFILMITSWPLNVAAASGVPPYMIDRHQPALHESSKVSHIVTFPRLRVN